MTNRIFVISDTHFCHAKVIEFEREHRPFETIEAHDEELVYRWNHTVKPKDTVWHLGDVVFGRSNIDILSRLNGVKKLVMGNHDTMRADEYLRYFNSVHACVRKGGFLMSHVPIHPYQFYRFTGNIHGHMHSETLDDPRYECVSVERTELAPILMDTAMHNVRRRIG